MNARRNTIRGAAALAVLDGIDRLIVTRGKKLVEIDLVSDRPGDDALLGLLLGPSGNLRAPTARIGGTLLVGFHQPSYARLLND